MLTYKWIQSNSQEFSQAVSIRKEVFIKEQHVPEAEEIDVYEDRCLHLLIFSDNIPVATCRVKPSIDSGSLKLQRVAVSKDFRKNGIGSFLMNQVELWAIQNGFKEIYFSAQDQAISFYEHLGYSVCDSEGFLECNIPHHNMSKKLQ